jgi:hypothetical protein
VWVSFRRVSDDHRLGRSGFWHFNPADSVPTRDVVLATIAAVQSCRPRLTLPLLAELKIGVTFFTALERVRPADLDFRRYGIVVQSLVQHHKCGGALPNTQMYTSSWEQYLHAKNINAKLSPLEPHEVFRHDLAKRIEPGASWPAYGEDDRRTDGWTEQRGLGEALTRRAWEFLKAQITGEPVPAQPLGDDWVRPVPAYVAVSLYDGGLVGRVIQRGDLLDEAVRAAAIAVVADGRFGAHRSRQPR